MASLLDNEASMNSTTRFCFGCNEKIALTTDQGVCPHCGQTLAEALDAPTLEIKSIQDRGTYYPDHSPADSRVLELIGKQLGNYHIERLLGQGGMARVFLAQHATLLRPCALKVLNRQLSDNRSEYVEMFLAEARAAASLVHPNVVSIHSLGQDQGWHFIEMEYVPGVSLQSRIEAQPPDPFEATEYMVQIGSALAVAHQSGIVHRDIKPANALINEGNCAKLADFGLAKRITASGSQPMVGTPYFMAPELFQGQSADTRSDVYAMGVTYYYLLTRHLPFKGNTVEQLSRQHCRAEAPDPRKFCSDIPEEACQVLRHCLEKSPAKRPHDAMELLPALRAVFGALRSLELLLREALEGLSLTLEGSGNRFQLRVPLNNGRFQTVLVESTDSGPHCERLVKIYSRCAPVQDKFLHRALELNSTIPHGAIAIETIDGAAEFVMGNSYPRTTCDPEEIRKSVLTIAHYADQIEHQLTGRDLH